MLPCLFFPSFFLCKHNEKTLNVSTKCLLCLRLATSERSSRRRRRRHHGRCVLCLFSSHHMINNNIKNQRGFYLFILFIVGRIPPLEKIIESLLFDEPRLIMLDFFIKKKCCSCNFFFFGQEPGAVGHCRETYVLGIRMLVDAPITRWLCVVRRGDVEQV